jgi:hypothetical protein
MKNKKEEKKSKPRKPKHKHTWYLTQGHEWPDFTYAVVRCYGCKKEMDDAEVDERLNTYVAPPRLDI